MKEGLPGPNAFLAGWTSWFAHAVAGSLYALGFGSYLGLVLEELGWLPVGLAASTLEKPLAMGIALLFVAINFKGVSETGVAGNVVTLAKVGIIGVFIVTGLWAMFHEPGSWERFTPFTPEGRPIPRRFRRPHLARGPRRPRPAPAGGETVASAGPNLRPAPAAPPGLPAPRPGPPRGRSGAGTRARR